MSSNDSTKIVADLHPRLRRFLVERLGWRQLREVQVRAYEPISSGRHTLVCAPTASGKTEAVFIPVVNRLLKENTPPLFCLYISPLRALLDDCYERFAAWKQALDIEIVVRHGERKTPAQRLCNNPPHLLMTTPESLEALLVYRTKAEKHALFSQLQAVVIDEVHNFLPTHRGAQLSSLLVRLRSYCERAPQIIGLSATVGDPRSTLAWLTGGQEGEIVNIEESRRMEYLVCMGSSSADAKLVTRAIEQADKAIVFVGSRAKAEVLARRLSARFRRGRRDVVLVHHSSLDAELKQVHQEHFKSREHGIMVATSTLELGIDIGDLDLVVHYQPPHSADSFLQRSGRAGRRGKPAHVVVVAQSPAEVLIATAEVSLAKKGIVEPQRSLCLAYEVLLQQLLCLILEHGHIPLTAAWQELLSHASAFRNISEAEYRDLIEYWAQQELIEISQKHQISLGRLAEMRFGAYNYRSLLSNIPFAREFRVVSARNGKEIGRVDLRFGLALQEGDEFLLAGQPRRVHLIQKDGKIYVLPGSQEKPPHWSSGIGGLSYLVARECWRLMTEHLPEQLSDSIAPTAQNIISQLRQAATDAGWQSDVVPAAFDADENRWVFLTFAGHSTNALLRDMAIHYAGAYDARITGFALSLKCPMNAVELWDRLGQVVSDLKSNRLGDLIQEPRPLTVFDGYLPEQYLKQANADARYDLDGARDILSSARVLPSPVDEVQILRERLE